jgi:hypothetical protein
MQNFTTLGQPLLGEKYGTPKERKKERKRRNAIISGHYFLPATPKGSARSLLGPKLFHLYLLKLYSNFEVQE